LLTAISVSYTCLVNIVPKETGDDNETDHALYCFFPKDIHQWHKRSGNYILSLPSYETCTQQFKDNVLENNFKRLRGFIQESTIQDEMGVLDFSNPNNSGLLVMLLDSDL
jgi:hypothetical protein